MLPIYISSLWPATFGFKGQLHESFFFYSTWFWVIILIRYKDFISFFITFSSNFWSTSTTFSFYIYQIILHTDASLGLYCKYSNYLSHLYLNLTSIGATATFLWVTSFLIVYFLYYHTSISIFSFQLHSFCVQIIF